MPRSVRLVADPDTLDDKPFSFSTPLKGRCIWQTHTDEFWVSCRSMDAENAPESHGAAAMVAWLMGVA